MAQPVEALSPSSLYEHVEVSRQTLHTAAGRQLTTLLTADPFIVRHNSSWVMFFEMTKPGMQIAFAVQSGWTLPQVTPAANSLHQCYCAAHPAEFAPDTAKTRTAGECSTIANVLANDWLPHVANRTSPRPLPTFSWGGWVHGLAGSHVSYPHVVRVDGKDAAPQYFMAPMEKDLPLVLYQAVDFPKQWTPVATLVDRSDLNDCSMVAWHNRWYIFCGMYRFPALYCRQLLYVSVGSSITGPYTLHPRSVPHLALGGSKLDFGRNAGRIVAWGSYLIRPTQRYGRGTSPYGPLVRAAVIRELTPASFKEEYHPWWVLALSMNQCAGTVAGVPVADQLWNGYGAHHIDMQPDGDGGWIAVTDGREAERVTASRIHHRCARFYLQAAQQPALREFYHETPECAQWIDNHTTASNSMLGHRDRVFAARVNAALRGSSHGASRGKRAATCECAAWRSVLVVAVSAWLLLPPSSVAR